MVTTLSKLWNRYKLLSDFKTEMNKRGYVARDLYCIDIQIDLLKEVIQIESMNVLNELLKKTYYRLLKSIERGIEYLPDIIENPENYVLNNIDKDPEAWIDNDTLIFSTKSATAVFSKISRKDIGSHYVDNKFQ